MSDWYILVTLSFLNHYLENTYWEKGVKNLHFLAWITEIEFDGSLVAWHLLCSLRWPQTLECWPCRHALLLSKLCNFCDFWDSISQLNPGFKPVFSQGALELLLFNFLGLLVMCIRNKDLGPRVGGDASNLCPQKAVARGLWANLTIKSYSSSSFLPTLTPSEEATKRIFLLTTSLRQKLKICLCSLKPIYINTGLYASLHIHICIFY